ncbi:MAG: hypothetical protein FWG03_09650 [Clostridiales bacterium]|nr:hypothetical protein [Clostridiales bacterium]
MRDFFYNKGDVFIAVLIILAAAFVIYMRVGVIMDYSASGSNGGSLLPMPSAIGDWGDQAPVVEADEGSGQNGMGDGAGDPPLQPDATQPDTAQPDAGQPEAGQPDAGQPGASQPGQGEGQDGEESSMTALEAEQVGGSSGQPGQTPGPSGPSVQITVEAGDAASTIADKLLAAGAISDKQAFLSEVAAQGADSKLKIGTFTIPKGSTVSEVIAILVG